MSNSARACCARVGGSARVGCLVIPSNTSAASETSGIAISGCAVCNASNTVVIAQFEVSCCADRAIGFIWSRAGSTVTNALTAETAGSN